MNGSVVGGRQRKWQPEWDLLLGKQPDKVLARALGLCDSTIAYHRRLAGIVLCATREIPCSGGCGKTLQRDAHANESAKCRACQLKQRRIRAAAWREDNREYIRKYDREWLEANKPHRYEQLALWIKEHRAHWLHTKRQNKKKVATELDRFIASLPCLDCGMFHTAEARQRVIRRMLPCETIEIHDAWPCFFGRGGAENKSSAGTQRLLRDLKAIGATRHGSTWYERRAEVAA